MFLRPDSSRSQRRLRLARTINDWRRTIKFDCQETHRDFGTTERSVLARQAVDSKTQGRFLDETLRLKGHNLEVHLKDYVNWERRNVISLRPLETSDT